VTTKQAHPAILTSSWHPNTHSELRDPSGLRTLWQNRSFAGSGEADPEA
jgi:hypothetical protein